MRFFPLETIHPHTPSTTTATQAVLVIVEHFHQFHPRDGLDQGTWFIVDLVDPAQITRVVECYPGLDFFLECGFKFIQMGVEEL